MNQNIIVKDTGITDLNLRVHVYDLSFNRPSGGSINRKYLLCLSFQKYSKETGDLKKIYLDKIEEMKSDFRARYC